MATKKHNAWKLDRTTVHLKSKPRPRSNKYSKSDNDQEPAPGTRGRVWVGGYVRADGHKVAGHYRSAANR